MYKKIFPLFLIIIFFLNITILRSQTYRYLKVEIVECDNFKIQELNWFAQGVDYPNPHLTSTIPSNNPNGEQAFGDTPASWEHLNVYDDDETSHMWFGYIDNPDLSLHITLDLGVGNAILPDSVEMVKPDFTGLSQFIVWASTDNQNWAKYLDTTIIDSYWARGMFPLALISDIEVPTPPTNLLANYITTHSLKLNWNASSDNIGVEEYEIFQDAVNIETTTQTNYVISGLSANTNYDYYIIARDFEQNESSVSNQVSVFTNRQDSEIPSTPLSLMNDYIDSQSVGFSWDSSTDNIAVIGYIVYLDGHVVGTTNETNFTIPGLDAETTYNIAVLAKDAAGNKSILSETLTLTTTSNANDKMKIATNFWTVHWGNSDPFNNTYNLVDEENPWNKELLDEVRIYGGFRFMDWAQTNNLTLDHWLDRTTLKDLNQEKVAYEWMIDFCNKTNKDIWICVPHRVISRDGYEHGDNHFVKKLAILLKTGVDMQGINLDNPAFENLAELTRNELIALGGAETCKPLNPHLKIYIEYSNETWNWGFGQTSYSHEESKHLNLNPGYSGNPDEDWTSWARYHSWAALSVFEQMEDVLGANTPRLVKLDAYQAVNVSHLINNRFHIYEDPDALYNPRGIFPDAFSPAPYFGGAESNDMTEAFPEFMSNINDIAASVRGTRAFLDTKETQLGRKFKLIAYEGGQHDYTGADIINRAPEMYDLYTTYLDSMNVYLDEFWHYNHVARFSDGGAWGAKEYIGAPDSISHKYRALKDWIGGDPLPALDTIPPSIPINLIENSSSKTSVIFSWDTSTDNVEVYGYKIYVEGYYIGSTSNTFFELSGLSSSSSYNITIRTIDTSGNLSSESTALIVSTLTTYAVNFAITDGDSPIENASIDFNGETILTDDEGGADFVNLLPSSNINYIVSKTDYETGSGSLDLVDANITENVELVLLVNTTIVEDEDQFVSIYYDQSASSFIIRSDKKINNLEAYSVSGSLVLKSAINGFDKEVSVQHLSQGVYFITLTFDDNTLKTLKIFRH